VNIGLFGGTFDPPHVGHLIAAQDACAALSLDRFLFVPAAAPPHKLDRSVTPPELREEMLRAAVQGNEKFEICDIELRRSGPSYTVDTLRQLRTEWPGATFFLLLGVDQVREFATWREPETILRLARIVMLTREGAERAPSDVVHDTVAVTRIDISSTLIRTRIAAHQPIRYLVPDAVAAIIAREGLYACPASVPDQL
jgi:nicotinate-nucleotide adenylyltransferase